MKTLFILGVFIYWCWAGHGGIASVGAAVHALGGVLSSSAHVAAHLCGAPALGSVHPVRPAGSHWN